MTAIAMDIAKMVDMLPESEQRLAHEVLKRLFLPWFPHFEQVTPDEANRIAAAQAEAFVVAAAVNWDDLTKY